MRLTKMKIRKITEYKIECKFLGKNFKLFYFKSSLLKIYLKKKDKEIDRILNKYYSKDEIKYNHNREIFYFLIEPDCCVPDSYVICLHKEFQRDNDYRAFQELVRLLDGKISYFSILLNCFYVEFKNHVLDKLSLDRMFSIKFVQSELSPKITDSIKPQMAGRYYLNFTLNTSFGIFFFNRHG